MKRNYNKDDNDNVNESLNDHIHCEIFSLFLSKKKKKIIILLHDC